jgi:hypothetical protein
VLNECVERVPDTFDAAKQLLEYGLRGTDARVLQALSKGDKDIGFIIRHKHDDEHHEQPEEKQREEIKKIEGSLDFTRCLFNSNINRIISVIYSERSCFRNWNL